MPTLNPSELNVVVSVLGAFTILYGIIAVKIKQAWFLGEARKLFSPLRLKPVLMSSKSRPWWSASYQAL